MPIYPPYVIERTSRGERSYDIFSRLLMDRIVFLGSGVDDNAANIILAQLLFLDAEDPEEQELSLEDLELDLESMDAPEGIPEPGAASG